MSSIGPGRSTIVLILNSAPIVDCENIGGIESRFMRTLHVDVVSAAKAIPINAMYCWRNAKSGGRRRWLRICNGARLRQCFVQSDRPRNRCLREGGQ
jgi:hypothetical protein